MYTFLFGPLKPFSVQTSSRIAFVTGQHDRHTCSLQALNQDRARTYFSCPSEASMWDMIDLSAMPSGHPGVQSGDVSLHHAFQERFWEHTPTSTTDFWDEYSRVCQVSAVYSVVFSICICYFARHFPVISSPTLQLNDTLQPR